jgi:hypothetical protein
MPASMREIPSRPVQKLPDFVFFSHARHVSGKVECATCHAAFEVRYTMKACVDCHRQAKATLVCTACHELGQ